LGAAHKKGNNRYIQLKITEEAG